MPRHAPPIQATPPAGRVFASRRPLSRFKHTPRPASQSARAPLPQPLAAGAGSPRGKALLMPVSRVCAVAGRMRSGRRVALPPPRFPRMRAVRRRRARGGCPGRGALFPAAAEPRAGSSSVGEGGWGKGPAPAWGAAGAAPLAGPGAPPDSACGAARGACSGGGDGGAAPVRGERRHEEPRRAAAVNGRRGGAGGAGGSAAAMAQEKMELDLELPAGSAAAPSDGGGLRRSNSAPLIHGLR